MTANECTTIKFFANWVDNRGELPDKLLKPTPQKDNQGQLARLKQAWREAEAFV